MNNFLLKIKKVFFILLALFLLYILWLSFILLTFKTHRAPTSEASPLEIEGVYHLHTTFSDGRKSQDEILKLTSKEELDFIIFTDHGAPNMESYSSQGWKDGILVLSGCELYVNRGHLVGVGFTPPQRVFSNNAEEAVDEIKKQGGFSIIPHPYSSTTWTWGEFVDYSGIEIINAYSRLMEKDLFLIPYAPALLFKPEYLLLKMLVRPDKNLKKWDELNTIHPIYGYFCSDAHRLYRSLLNLLRSHLLLQAPLSEDFETASKQVYEALRKGRFYNSIHAAAHAHGFRFRGEKMGEMIPMGSTVLLDSPVRLHIKAPFRFKKEIHLIHNGKVILRSTEENVIYEALLPGTYRVEVYLRARSPLRKNIPWVVSNPIFLIENKK
ncbi:MAG: PHP domain-containing protein [Candidatus Aminicenantaceae bacterium]